MLILKSGLQEKKIVSAIHEELIKGALLIMLGSQVTT